MAHRHIGFPLLVFLLVGCLLGLRPAPAWADQHRSGHLVSVDWLQDQLKTGYVLLLDASAARTYAAKHIPGAVNVDIYNFAVGDLPVE
ncbi:MAG TPA: rhodanese-like domain-containing protein, partial [Rubrivivax sp.]|nr:rhodanese-like domain-containing protein [Rubrivivax sp.]